MKITRDEPLHWFGFRDEKVELVDKIFINPRENTREFHRGMFDDDFSRVFSLMNRGKGKLFEIDSNDSDLTQKLLLSIKKPHSLSGNDEIIRRLLEEITQSLTWCGKAYYFVHEEQEKIHITSLSSVGIVSLFGTLIQWVPKRVERHWDKDDEDIPRVIRILDNSRLMSFSMPKPLKRMLSKQNKTFSTLDKHNLDETNFNAQATYENPNPTSDFNFGEWKETRDDAFYHATKNTGWTGRKYDSSQRSDFFDCHRLIRFRRNQLTLRDEILNQLSHELTKIGKNYKVEFSVKVSGSNELPTISQLNELEKKLEREELGFKEILDYCYEF